MLRTSWALGLALIGPACPGRDALLGSARTPGGARIQLTAVWDAAGPCLHVDGLPGGPRGCGRAPSERVPPARAAIGGGVFAQRSPHAPLELYGETAPDVQRVVVRYRLHGDRAGARAATLIRASHAGALRRAGIRGPFGYFVAFAPPRAQDVIAEARDASGALLGRLRYDGIIRSLHPTAFIAEPTGGG